MLYILRTHESENDFFYLCFIGETIREDVVAKVGQSSFYSILIDETTDISVLKQLIIYVKFMVGEECQIKFLAMEDVSVS